MLAWIYYLLLAALLGGVVGFGLITRRIVLIWYQVVIVFGLMFFLCLISIYIGRGIGDYIPFRVLNVMTGILFVGIGGYLTIIKPEYPGYKEMVLLYIVIILEACLLGYRYGHLHQGGLFMVLLLISIEFGGVAGGTFIGGRKWSNWRVKLVLPQLCGMLIILLGILKMI